MSLFHSAFLIDFDSCFDSCFDSFPWFFSFSKMWRSFSADPTACVAIVQHERLLHYAVGELKAAPDRGRSILSCAINTYMLHMYTCVCSGSGEAWLIQTCKYIYIYKNQYICVYTYNICLTVYICTVYTSSLMYDIFRCH